MTIQKTSTVYARIENRPGALARATRTIADKQINIEGISADTAGGTGFVRFHTARPREVVSALRSQGFEAYESEAVIAGLQNRPGELSRVLSDLAAAGINVEAITPTADGKLAFRTSDVDRTQEILRKVL